MNTRAYTKEPTKNKIVHRLKIVQGHLDKVIKMAEGDAYCIDVIHQSQAVQAALKSVDKIILDNHLHSCVLGGVKKGDIDEERLVKEIVDVFQKSES